MSDKQDQPPQPTPQPSPLASEATKSQPAETVFYAADAGTSPDDVHIDAPTEHGHPPAAPPLGRIGHYEIHERIGQGGMGVVLRARDPKLRRDVAIKVLAPHLASDPAARRRFLREAQAAAAVGHPNVVTIFAVDDQDPPYLVMECVVGESLDDRLQRVGALPVDEVVRIGIQIAEGLAAAHTRGLIHRDIKPANILLEQGSDRVKITDFGLARAASDASATQSGLIAGTPQFMSPEQAEGETLDPRSDLFSLGSVLYAMTTGQTPFAADTLMGVLRKVCNAQPAPVRTLQPNSPGWLAAIIAKLMAKAPADRFATAAEVVAALQRQGLAPPRPTEPSERRFPRGRLVLFAAAAALSVVMAVVAIASRRGSQNNGEPTSPGTEQHADSPTATERAPAKWVSLIDDDLSQWKSPTQPDAWSSANGEIVGTLDRNQMSSLNTSRDFQDFSLRFEVLVERGALTSTWVRNPEQDVWGYQLPVNRSGDVIQAGNILKVAGKREAPEWKPIAGSLGVVEIPTGRWIKYEITADGDSFIVRIDDKIVSQGHDDAYPKGHISLSLAGFGQADGARARWRNMEIRELRGDAATRTAKSKSQPADAPAAAPPDAWQKLIDSQQTAWLPPQGFGEGTWEVEHDELVGSVAVDAAYRLVTRAEFADFHFRGEAKIELGHRASLWFRSLDHEHSYAAGFEREKDRGGFGYLTRADRDESTGGLKLSDFPGSGIAFVENDVWTKVEVIANGASIQVLINGKLTSQATDDTYRRGRLALGIQGEPATGPARVRWRNIEVRELHERPPAGVPSPGTAASDAAASQRAAAEKAGVPVEFENSVGMKFRLIPTGKFMMGSTPEQLAELEKGDHILPWTVDLVKGEAPQRQVTIDKPFYLAETKVTQRLFRKFVDATGYKSEMEADPQGGVWWNPATKAQERSPTYNWRSEQFTSEEEYPVAFVTPNDGLAFCKWLSDKEGCEYSLPSEEQWEFACRAGSTGHWHWGNDPQGSAPFEWTGGGKHAVGLKAPNPFGLFDIHRNGLEICTTSDGYISRSCSSGFDIWNSRCASRRLAEMPPGPDTSFRVGIFGDLKKVGKSAQ